MDKLLYFNLKTPSLSNTFGSPDGIVLLITHAQKPPSNVHAEMSNGDSGLNVGVSLFLLPFIVCVRIEYSVRLLTFAGLSDPLLIANVVVLKCHVLDYLVSPCRKCQLLDVL